MAAVIGSLRVNLGVDTAAFGNGLKTAGGKLAAFGAVARKAAIGIAAIGTTAAIGMGAAIAKTITAADQMNEAAQKFGIPLETLSRLNYAAKLSGVSLETLGTSVGRLSRLMASAADGGKPAIKVFEDMGVAFANADGKLRPTEQVLADIAEVMKGMPDGAAKTALAMAAMGKGGAQMIPLLNGGRDALKGMMAEADTFGQVFTAEMGANADLFGDNIDRLKGAFGNIAADLATKLLPYLAQFTTWLVENGPRLADVVVGFVKLGAAIIGVSQNVIQFVTNVASAMQQAVQAVENGINDIAAAFTGLRDKFVQIGRDLIAGLIDGLKAGWAALKAEVTGVASGIVSTVKDRLGIESPSTVFAEIGRNIMGGLSEGLGADQDGIRRGMDGFAQDIASTFEGILTGATNFKTGLRDILTGTLSSAGSDLISKGISGFADALGIPTFANGGRAPGGLALVGERGPELVSLPRGSRVFPNGAGDMGGRGLVYAPVIDARGADPAAITRLELLMRSQAADFERTFRDRTMAAVADPRYRGRS